MMYIQVDALGALQRAEASMAGSQVLQPGPAGERRPSGVARGLQRGFTGGVEAIDPSSKLQQASKGSQSY